MQSDLKSPRVQRQSNIEILRIIAMFLVLFGHYLPTRLTLSPDMLKTDFWASVGQMELQSFTFISVNCFVLITGYFGINWKIRSFSWLIWLIAVWGIIAFVCSVALQSLFHSPHYADITKFFELTFTQRWFIGSYISLYVLAPILNSYIEKSSQKQLGSYIVFFYIFSTIFGYILHSSEFNEGMSVISLIGLYLLGAFIRKFKIKFFSFNRYIDLLIFFALGQLLVLGSIAIYKLGINKSIYGYLNPIIIIESVYLFLFFTKLKIKNISFINLIAASTFSAYLFHHHIYIFPYYLDMSHYINTNSPLPLITIIFGIIIIMMACTLVDQAIKRIYNLGYNYLNRKFSINKQTLQSSAHSNNS